MSQLEISFKRNMVDFVNELQNICCPNEPKIFIVKHLLENVISPQRCMDDFEKHIYTHKCMIVNKDLKILTEREMWDNFHPYVGDMITSFNISNLNTEDLECLWKWMNNFCKFIEYRQTINMK